ncbi:MAG: cyclic nucleotide-binding domain-containing protein [Candidatus Omnitrophota bacterium]
MKNDTQLKIIQRMSILNQLDLDDIEDMLEKKIICFMEYEPGEVIIHEKSSDRRLFFIKEGRVRISKEVISGNLRRSEDIETFDCKDKTIGEMSAFTGKPRTATVTALTKTVCVPLDVQALLEKESILGERVRSKLYPGLFKLVCDRLAETDDKMVHYKQKARLFEKENDRMNDEKIRSEQDWREQIRRKVSEIKKLEALLEKPEC